MAKEFILIYYYLKPLYCILSQKKRHWLNDSIFKIKLIYRHFITNQLIKDLWLDEVKKKGHTCKLLNLVKSFSFSSSFVLSWFLSIRISIETCDDDDAATELQFVLALNSCFINCWVNDDEAVANSLSELKEQNE